jgi:5'-3' exonuclease
MGIPSYYKKLTRTVKSLVSYHHPSSDIGWLFMDFNCMIYHCLHKEYLNNPNNTVFDTAWELRLIQTIVEYCLNVIKRVSPVIGVYIAVDGVVPMAKMRQQRLRRFIVKNEENEKKTEEKKTEEKKTEEKKTEEKDKWDKNAITPGTAFMQHLKLGLEKMIESHSGSQKWILSSSDEPGEGEHKIMAEWRKGLKGINYAVYGLDGDLIVLSILGRESCSLENHVWLFREEIQGGKMVYDSAGEEKFEWFSVDSLSDWIAAELCDISKKKAALLSYGFAMSVLGNDFLPRSMSLIIRDNGHNELLYCIRTIMLEGHTLIDDSNQISIEGITRLFDLLRQGEHARLVESLRKRESPPVWLQQIITPIPLTHEERGLLSEIGWQKRYLTQCLSVTNITDVCKEYLYGMQWIWAYYIGHTNDVCYNWFYTYSLPPLWEWLSEFSHSNSLPTFPDKVMIRAADIQPIEQLALVLPLRSWYLIPIGSKERRFPLLAPQYFPATFGFEKIGKNVEWEWEAKIPIPTIVELKAICG